MVTWGETNGKAGRKRDLTGANGENREELTQGRREAKTQSRKKITKEPGLQPTTDEHEPAEPQPKRRRHELHELTRITEVLFSGCKCRKQTES